MAQRGRSASETQAEIEAYRDRMARRGRVPSLPSVGKIVGALAWMVAGAILAVVVMPLLPDGLRSQIGDFQDQIAELRDDLTGSNGAGGVVETARDVLEDIEKLQESLPETVSDLVPKAVETPQAIGVPAATSPTPLPSPPSQNTTVSAPSGSVGPSSVPPAAFTGSSAVPMPFGPMMVTGIYCWYQDSDDTTRLRFAIYNPTNEELEVRVEAGVMRLGPGEHSLSDPIDIGNGSDCKYDFSTTFHETLATSTTATSSAFGVGGTSTSMSAISTIEVASTTFTGVEVQRPVLDDIQDQIDRLFADLDRADLDAVETHFTNSSIDLVALIAWRTFVTPVRTTIDSCQLGFAILQADEFPIGSAYRPATSTVDRLADIPEDDDDPVFGPTIWDCNVAIQYASTRGGASSGTWHLIAVEDIRTGELQLRTDQQPG